MGTKAKAISFTPVVLKAKLRALEQYGQAQTRRPIKPTPPQGNGTERWTFCVSSTEKTSINRFTLAQVDPSGCLYTERGRETVLANVRPPLGLSGQVLWVRERARLIATEDGVDFVSGVKDARVRLRYEDGVETDWIDYPKRLSFLRVGQCIPNGVHREGARHFLEVVEVRVEKVRDISDNDALLEGIERFGADWTFNGGLWLERTARKAYFALYDSIYGAGAHERDWCFVYTLRKAAKP